ncbi:dihydrolipoyl dehydrogenase family protein [Phaeobacter porticola]|uniref:Pyridine nucleotide-disulfide oxidoreductase n=1 Tax=Phaeobacter porticola TaxID=1844006 RepID=A0A1L3I0I1_9RHOB|nr:FAD-dependent oxidoreductase [Phaeobacter porticola]APG45633.1 pyridine nucleotide-disulfide oxidoreductase [Phaeobacter porticola]
MSHFTHHPAASHDLVVIGGGSGGLAAAKAAARLGASVVLIEQAELGGTCVNRGCTPKKLMWKAASHQQGLREMESVSLTDVPSFDFATLRRRSDAKIDKLNHHFEEELEQAGVRLLRGRAEVGEAGQIHAGGEVFQPGKLLLATGARPRMLDIPGGELAATSDDVFGWDDLPARLLIIGGGYIGCEFASIFAAFGSEVHLMTDGERLLDQFHAPAVDCVQAGLNKQGVNLGFGIKPTQIDFNGTMFKVSFDDGSIQYADRVIAAIGRIPNTDQLGPGLQGIKCVKSGALAIDTKFQTSIPGIYAIGDAADRLPLTPVATRDGACFAAQHFGDNADQIDLNLVATSAYTLPPISQVGRLEADHDDGETISNLSSDVLDDGTAAHSFFAAAFSDNVLNGVALINHAGPDMIAPFAALIASGATAEDIAAATGIHPSFGEETVGR